MYRGFVEGGWSLNDIEDIDLDLLADISKEKSKKVKNKKEAISLHDFVNSI